MSDFDPVEFMKNQKTVVENMLTLGASKESAEYAMHIINSQDKKIKKSNWTWIWNTKADKKMQNQKPRWVVTKA